MATRLSGSTGSRKRLRIRAPHSPPSLHTRTLGTQTKARERNRDLLHRPGSAGCTFETPRRATECCSRVRALAIDLTPGFVSDYLCEQLCLPGAERCRDPWHYHVYCRAGSQERQRCSGTHGVRGQGRLRDLREPVAVLGTGSLGFRCPVSYPNQNRKNRVIFLLTRVSPSSPIQRSGAQNCVFSRFTTQPKGTKEHER